MKTKTKGRRRKGRDAARDIALAELRAMVPAFLLLDAVVSVIAVIVGLVGANGVDWRVFTGLAVGNVAGALNFYLMALTAGRAVRGRTAQRARRSVMVGYGARYITLFAVFGVLITFKLVNPLTVSVPLLYPSFYYKITALFRI
ncbi:MAG: ATP synthase subunit I [Oscillospiraceae bacterium]|jgi:hypothetical protein|nr:ATP synthase subunit I [Oscillospiraceae bacterium]